jgi:hypothetical protein
MEMHLSTCPMSFLYNMNVIPFLKGKVPKSLGPPFPFLFFVLFVLMLPYGSQQIIIIYAQSQNYLKDIGY